MALLLADIMVVALVIYVLLAGADYGAGLWDLFSSGPSRKQQQELIAKAIQPIWEANHVWLVLILVLLFSGFPPAFATIMSALPVPLLLMLAGIVLRGSSFVFRAYSTPGSRMQRFCGYVFSVSSCFTPFFAGVLLGSVSHERVLVSQGVSVNGYISNWLHPFTICLGLLALALFAFLAAAYLMVECPTEELRRIFRFRALLTATAATIIAVATFFMTARSAPGLRESLIHNPLARCFELLAAITLVAALLALCKGRARLSRAMAAAHVASLTLAWAAAQYPYLVRPQWTIFNSVVSENVVRDIVIACVAGAVVLLPSLGLLLYIFKDQRSGEGLFPQLRRQEITKLANRKVV
jgi:cytochrome d ubiquinol oxidase subunit II